MNSQPALSKIAPAEFGSALYIAERARIYGQFMFSEEVFGADASAFIADYCKKALKRARAFSKDAQKQCAGKEAALVHLAGKVKYVLAHIELAACYGKQIGIMTEHRQFRQHALTYISLVQAETEALEYFDPDHLV